MNTTSSSVLWVSIKKACSEHCRTRDFMLLYTCRVANYGGFVSIQSDVATTEEPVILAAFEPDSYLPLTTLEDACSFPI